MCRLGGVDEFAAGGLAGGLSDGGGALALPEHLGDVEGGVEEAVGGVEVAVDAGLGGCLHGVPEGVVEVGEFFQMLGLEVVAPEDAEFLLGELGVVLLDGGHAGDFVAVDLGFVLGSVGAGLFEFADEGGHSDDGMSGDLGEVGVVDAAGTSQWAWASLGVKRDIRLERDIVCALLALSLDGWSILQNGFVANDGEEWATTRVAATGENVVGLGSHPHPNLPPSRGKG